MLIFPQVTDLRCQCQCSLLAALLLGLPGDVPCSQIVEWFDKLRKVWNPPPVVTSKADERFDVLHRPRYGPGGQGFYFGRIWSDPVGCKEKT